VLELLYCADSAGNSTSNNKLQSTIERIMMEQNAAHYRSERKKRSSDGEYLNSKQVRSEKGKTG